MNSSPTHISYFIRQALGEGPRERSSMAQGPRAQGIGRTSMSQINYSTITVPILNFKRFVSKWRLSHEFKSSWQLKFTLFWQFFLFFFSIVIFLLTNLLWVTFLISPWASFAINCICSPWVLYNCHIICYQWYYCQGNIMLPLYQSWFNAKIYWSQYFSFECFATGCQFSNYMGWWRSSLLIYESSSCKTHIAYQSWIFISKKVVCWVFTKFVHRQ